MARSSKEQAKRRASPRSIGQRDPSLRWPHLYDILRSKGHSKEAAARISNSHLKYRKKGRLQGLPWQQADNPAALARVRKGQQRKRSARTASALVAACHDRSCAPPPAGKGGSSVSSDGRSFKPDADLMRKVRSGAAQPKRRKTKEEKRKEARDRAEFLKHDRSRLRGRSGRYPWGVGDRGVVAAAIELGLDIEDLACHDRSCAPPPVGTGGSKAGGSLSGTNAMTLSWSDLNDRIDMFNDMPRMRIKNQGEYNELIAESKRRVESGRKEPFREITAEMGARGDSKAVSAAEFQALAIKGQSQLDAFAENSSPITGLDDNWSALKDASYAEATQSWGGATIDSHTGEILPQGVDKFALTVKDAGIETVSIPENATRAEFDMAMDAARDRFRPILERSDHHLGVFHDDDLGRIDFDPVLVVNDVSDVHSIGAATLAIGGAYRFSDGNGYWPPHVAEG